MRKLSSCGGVVLAAVVLTACQAPEGEADPLGEEQAGVGPGFWRRDSTAPSIPASLVATTISSSGIDLRWDRSTDNGRLKGYTIFRDGTPIATLSGTAYSDTGLSASTAYTYSVSAIDVAGNESAQSSSVQATTSSATTPPANGNGSTCNANMASFKLTGDPASKGGATWTYVSTDAGVSYDIKGILFKPSGTSATYPGVIVSHGLGGTAPVEAAKRMVAWGAAVIGTNYTHSSDTSGLPAGDPGASSANLQRAHKAWDILCGLGYVDMKRIAAHGHSMGAFVTAGLVGAYPKDFVVASHTAGGVNDRRAPTWTSSAQANGITVPYQAHHGDADTVVPLTDDQTLDSLLTARGVVHELHVYAGYTHPDVRDNDAIMSTIKDWYTAHGLF